MSKWYYRFPSGHGVDLLIYSNFNPGFSFFLSNSLAWILFSIFWAHPIIKLYAKRIQLNWLFKLSYLGLKFAQALGYVNPALNKPALVVSDCMVYHEPRSWSVRFDPTHILLTLFEEETVPSAVRCGKDRILCCLILGIHASRNSIPLSLLMLLEYEVYLMWIASLRECKWGSG